MFRYLISIVQVLRESQAKDDEIDSKVAERVKRVEEEEKERQKLTDINGS